MRKSNNRKHSVTLVFLTGLAFVGVGWADLSEAAYRCNKKMEAKLERDFSFYTDNAAVMEFNFNVEKQVTYVEVDLLGQNFDANDPDWVDKEGDSFTEYIESVGETVAHEMEKPMVRMHVIGNDGVEIAVFRYE